MARLVGIWIDHHKAFIVFVDGQEVTTTRVESGVKGRFRLSGGSRSATPWGPQDVASETKMEEKHKNQLRRFYARVVEAIRDAQRVLILGPGEAKTELKKQMGASKVLASKIAGLETADKMTERQIIARVREFYSQGR